MFPNRIGAFSLVVRNTLGQLSLRYPHVMSLGVCVAVGAVSVEQCNVCISISCISTLDYRPVYTAPIERPTMTSRKRRPNVHFWTVSDSLACYKVLW
jgi:hypothetical protein